MKLHVNEHPVKREVRQTCCNDPSKNPFCLRYSLSMHFDKHMKQQQLRNFYRPIADVTPPQKASTSPNNLSSADPASPDKPRGGRKYRIV